MWDEGRIEIYIKEKLKAHRYEHSLSVRDTAIKLAKRYNEDTFKARIAGLLHDCAKDMEECTLLSLVKEHGLEIDYVSYNSPQLLHGLVASIIARERMAVIDEDILNAVTYHTTGRKNMSKLEKIIYIADYVEPLRKFPGVDALRKTAEEDLDRAVLQSFNMTINYVIERKQLLHMNTVEGRNYLICENCR
jgi:predicted HD superfamily hydrolase involved in NAD metabolism